jgi:DNA-binding transcriptional ArsR family regulator
MIAYVSDVFEAIATPARRAILDELVERDGQTLFELCNRLAMKHQLGLTRQAISQHLEILESAGLVTTVRQGKYTCALNSNVFAPPGWCLRSHLSRWDP